MKKAFSALALCAFGVSANAALFHFEGNIDFHNDVIFTSFSLDEDATDVRIWTDSFMNGTNFDPITALWSADGALIDEDDDNDNINPTTQTRFDSGFTLSSLSAGDYIFSVATYNNFAEGDDLADGFRFDNQLAIALEDWDQPANRVGMGSYWSVWLDGVDSASNDDATVPEPASIALLGLGLSGLVLSRRRKTV